MKLDIEKLLMEVPITKIQHIENNEVYSLLEKFNMCGSIKVKPVYWILKNAIESWELDKDSFRSIKLKYSDLTCLFSKFIWFKSSISSSRINSKL